MPTYEYHNPSPDPRMSSPRPAPTTTSHSDLTRRSSMENPATTNGNGASGRTLGGNPSPLLRRASVQALGPSRGDAGSTPNGSMESPQYFHHSNHPIPASSSSSSAPQVSVPPPTSALSSSYTPVTSPPSPPNAPSNQETTTPLTTPTSTPATSPPLTSSNDSTPSSFSTMGSMRAGTQLISPYSRSPELRVSHKLAERKRRKEMKDLFEELKGALPDEAFRNSKASKWEILSKAIDYIETLAEVGKERDELRDENLELQRRLAAFALKGEA
ncbi:hypothetical protein HDU67_007300 [Dinochytrium kinnereticum]|nr:hypothetical protein HDU67_007300 [Dinochytrium kinnereticum]